MSTPVYIRATIASAGLDLLHATRLKVACSLLMAEKVDAALADWPHPGAGVLVTSLDTPWGVSAAAEAQAGGVRVLALSRDASGNGQLRHGATVREIFERLLALLVDAPQADPDALAAGTLVERLVREPGVVSLLRQGDIRVAVDAGSGDLYPAHGLDPARLLRASVDGGWDVATVARAEFDAAREAYGDATGLEAFVWRAAVASTAPVGAVTSLRPMALSGWPAIDACAVPAHWLLPLACMMRAPWQASALAQACDLPIDEITRIMAAVQHSGLRDNARSTRDARVHTPVKRSTDGVLRRLARRFGMHFGGARD